MQKPKTPRSLADAAAGYHWRDYQLLLPSLRTGTANLFLVEPETGDAKNVTRNGATNRFPAWSPDGTQCVFVSDLDGVQNVYVINADGGHLRQLTRERAPAVCFLPSWGHDGKIAFARDVSGVVEILVMDSLNDPPGVVGSGTDPCLSPDGKQIAFTRKSGHGYSVWVMNADGRKARLLKIHPNHLGAVVPTWSPDGRSLLYSGEVDGALEIFVCSARSGKSKRLTNLGKASTSAAWSPDGQWISFRAANAVFWSNPASWRAAQKRRDTLRPVYVMRADGSDVQPLAALRYQCATDGSRAVWRPGSALRGPTDACSPQPASSDHKNPGKTS